MLRRILFACLLPFVFLTGCASLPPGHIADERDPWERYNRAMFSFNEGVDKAVLKPVAQTYKANIPEVIRDRVSNFFANLSDLASVVHHTLQAEPRSALESTGRFVVNSTVGLFGLFDPATSIGLSRTNEDAGLTLGRWGVGHGPYVMLPLLGPSSLRDALGTAADMQMDLTGELLNPDTTERVALNSVRVVDVRTRLLELEKGVDLISFDRYVSVRSAYFGRRERLLEQGEAQ
jgi:phospholipid-binding lipoprotein MlaA